MGITQQVALLLSGGRPVTGRESDRALAMELVAYYGSQAATASALRVGAGKVRGWVGGTAASEVDRARLLAGVRAARVPERLRDDNMIFEDTDHHGQEVTVTSASLKIRPGTIDNVLDAYLPGDLDGAVDALIDGMGDQWYREQHRLGALRDREARRG